MAHAPHGRAVRLFLENAAIHGCGDALGVERLAAEFSRVLCLLLGPNGRLVELASIHHVGGDVPEAEVVVADDLGVFVRRGDKWQTTLHLAEIVDPCNPELGGDLVLGKCRQRFEPDPAFLHELGGG